MLRLNELSVSRGGRPLLHRIDVAFRPGLLYGLLGPNGAGKSSLFKTLTGVWSASSGELYWGRRELLSLDARARSQVLALMPQSPPCPFPFRVHELVAMGRYARGGYGRGTTHEEAVERALYDVDALHLRERPITELSCGERQRVYLARCLATESPVLLLDEPTSNLDIRHKLELWGLLRRLVDRERIIIAAVHDIACAERFCDEIALLDEGTLRGIGPFEEVLCDQQLRSVFGVRREDLPEEKIMRLPEESSSAS